MANITENCSAPTIKNPNSTLIEVFIGDNVTMTCLADGVPTPSVSWFKLNSKLVSCSLDVYFYRANKHSFLAYKLLN